MFELHTCGKKFVAPDDGVELIVHSEVYLIGKTKTGKFAVYATCSEKENEVRVQRLGEHEEHWQALAMLMTMHAMNAAGMPDEAIERAIEAGRKQIEERDAARTAEEGEHGPH